MCTLLLALYTQWPRPILPPMSGPRLQDSKILFTSSQSRPRAILILGACGHVGRGKLQQLCAELASEPQLDIPLLAVDIHPDVLKIKHQLTQRLAKDPRLDLSTQARALDRLQLIHGSINDVPTNFELGWILEALPEDLELKRHAYRELASREQTDPPYICSTTSALTTQSLFGDLAPAQRDRCSVLHPFFPHHRNRLWEMPTRNCVTSRIHQDEILSLMRGLKMQVIQVSDVASFAADRIFCGLMLESVRVLEEFNLDPVQVDTVCHQRLGPRPFMVHNLIPGSDRLSLHCMQLCHQEHRSSLFEPPARWLKQIQSANSTATWPYPQEPSSSASSLAPALQDKIAARIEGMLYCLSAYLLAHNVIASEDLDLLCTQALGFRQGPCERAQSVGVPQIKSCAQQFIQARSISLSETVAPLDALDKLARPR